MAKNFKICLNNDNGNIQLNLMGDFDGSSALELCHYLEKHTSKEHKTIINTDGLSDIHPFGLNIFTKRYTPKKCMARNLTFTGNYKQLLTI